jgi:carboxypeptidase family protein
MVETGGVRSAMGAIRLSALVVALAARAAPALAQDGATGTLVGSVIDQSGSPVKGVRLSAGSDTQIGGARVAYSGEGGGFRIVGLAPGVFEVTATAPKLRTVVQKGIRVGVSAPTSVDLVVEPESAIETVKVVDNAPAVSTTTATVKQVLEEEFVDNLPSDFKLGAEAVIANAVPGAVQASTRTARIRGGGANQTAYLVEGFDMVGQRSTLKAMAAIEVATAGYGAEYATIPGGVVNMVTKSGSNRFELDLNGFAEDNKLSFFLQPTDSRDRGFFYLLNPNFSGPIVKDKLWFFVNLEGRREQYVDPTDPQGLLPRNPDRIYGSLRGSGKVTWQVSARHKLVAFTNFNLRSNANQIRNYAPATEADAQQRTLDRDWMTGLIWESLLADNLFFKSQLAVQRFWDEVGPTQCSSNPDCDHLPAITELFPRETAYNNFGSHVFTTTEKSQLINTLELFPRAKLLGEHDIKLKTDFAIQTDTVTQSTPGDRKIVLQGGVPFRQTEYFSNDPRMNPAHHGWFISSGTSRRFVVSLSDAWRITRHLTVTPGAALVKADASGVDGAAVLDALAATMHLAAAWDPTHDGRTVIRASFNNYLDVNGADLARFTASPPVSQTCAWDASAGTYTRDCSFSGGASGRTVGSPCGPAGVNPDGTPCRQSLRVPRTWEQTAGIEREVVRGLSLAGDVIYRRYSHPYEQIETNRIWNRSGTELDALGGYRNGRSQAIADMETPSGARRDYLGVTVGTSKREGPLKINAAYTLSFLRGNVLDSASNQPFGEIRPRDIYLYGYLPDDSRHALRMTATYAWTSWLTTGALYNYQSGRPYQRRFTNTVTGGFDDYRAAVGVNPGSNVNDPGDDRPLRLPDQHLLNLQARINWRPLLGHDLETYVDVLNALALRTTTAVQQNDNGLGGWGGPTEILPPFRLRIGFRYRW